MNKSFYFSNLKFLMLCLSALAFFPISADAMTASSKEEGTYTEKKAISTRFATKDVVISDFIVTDFGAKAEPGFDNREAFQKAINAAYEAGGGVVYIPAGHYGFSSSCTGVKTVRVREGEHEVSKDFEYEYVLTLPTGVQLRGDWADPAEHDNKVAGTVLEVRVGKDAPDYDASVKSWWNDSQAGNALRTSYTNVADRFIELNPCTAVTNLSIWYPEQDIDNIRPYPWTLYQKKGDSATIEHVTLVNAYNGFISTPSELHYVVDSYITALNKGIEVHVCTDIGRIENVRISPEYWAASGLPGAPSLKKVKDYTMNHTIGFQMHRSDWEYVSGLEVEGCKMGMWIGKEPGFKNAPNAQLFRINLQDCQTGLFVEEVNPYGILISDSQISAAKKGKAVYFYEDFETSVQFNGVRFNGPVVSDGKDGVISFENCHFADTGHDVLTINSGNVLMTQCDFEGRRHHVRLGKGVRQFKTLNSGFQGQMDVKSKAAGAQISLLSDPEFYVEPIDTAIQTDIAAYPRPKSDLVFKADFPRATGYNNNCPDTDVSGMIQDALDHLASRGGGTLYLPAGRYLVNCPIVVPTGTELRGSWDVQHHTQGGGTALLTRYKGGKDGENGASLIQLKADSGLSGLLIGQLNIASEGHDMNNPLRTPFLVQGQGKNVYMVNCTISVGDKGVDLATCNTSGHYVNYLGGVLLRAGIWVGGGAEGGIIRNMQFNPHYSARLPKGGQGYPNVQSMKYIQSHCSALKFADVKNQTIFNNFVFGSVYGIHFLKDAVTGKYPGKMTMVGHGSDGCTFALFVEDADAQTEIIGINSELVNTRIVVEPVRAYVLMGKESGRVHPDATLALYNSAMWGSPIIGAIINGGQLHFRQANFTRTGNPAIDLNAGKVLIHSTYFAQPFKQQKDYFSIDPARGKLEECNNVFKIRK